jgi:cell division protease FtsH
MPDLGSGVSDELAAIVDEETRRIIDECYAVAEDTLRRERWRLEALATALLERESLDEEEIRQVTGLPAPPRPTAADLDGTPAGTPEDGASDGAPTGTPAGEAPARDGAAPGGAAHDGPPRDGSPAAPAPSAAPSAPAPLPSS